MFTLITVLALINLHLFGFFFSKPSFAAVAKAGPSASGINTFCFNRFFWGGFHSSATSLNKRTEMLPEASEEADSL